MQFALAWDWKNYGMEKQVKKNSHHHPLNPPTKKPILAHFVAKSAPFARSEVHVVTENTPRQP